MKPAFLCLVAALAAPGVAWSQTSLPKPSSRGVRTLPPSQIVPPINPALAWSYSSYYDSIDGDQIAVSVHEGQQGGTDLNGDGDTLDSVLHVYDIAAGTTRSLALASFSRGFADGFLAHAVNEWGEGVDLNGDGDLDDDILHVYDSASAVDMDTGLTLGPYTLVDRHDRRLAFGVHEQGHGDLNGDGDALDTVLHLLDLDTGVATNLGQAIVTLEIHDELLLYERSERDDGGIDLNGDGDALDYVLHVYDLSTGSTVNIGLATGAYNTGEVDGNWITFLVFESMQGETDLNGDGDTTDFVVFVHDRAAQQSFNLQSATDLFWGRPVVRHDRVVWAASEDANGGVHLNGDPDVLDRVLHVRDLLSQSTTNLGLAMPDRQPLSTDGETLAFAVGESEQRADLNGDGDEQDEVVHLLDLSTLTVSNTALSAGPYEGYQVRAGRVAIAVWEAGQRVDLNGDGDFGDYVLVVLDVASATAVTVRAAVYAPYCEPGGCPPIFLLGDETLIFPTLEREQGHTDLNADGDAADLVLHAFDLSGSQQLRTRSVDLLVLGTLYYSTCLICEYAPLILVEDRTCVFQGWEQDHETRRIAVPERDLNGDGDRVDRVALVARLKQ